MGADEGWETVLLSALLERVRASAAIDDLLGPGLNPVEVTALLSPVARASPALSWVGVNETRVDAVLVGDADQWRVVFGAEDGHRVDWLSVYLRPPVFVGVPGGRAVIVNGPSGAGKSTLLDSLRRTDAGRPWVIFDEPEHVGTVGAEFLIWREQAPGLHHGYLAAIGALAGAGNLVAVAAAGRTQAEFTQHLSGTAALWIGLYCDRDILVGRERSRGDRWGGLAEASMSVHDGWEYDLTFDTTDSPDPTRLAQAILKAIESEQS